jgi:phenylacetate-CoA ligase
MTPSQKSEYEKQKKRQEQWRCKTDQHIGKKAWILMSAEYADKGKRQAAREANLKQYFKFITRAIPYYQHRLGVEFDDQQDVIAYLRRCPILTKSLLRDHNKHLVAKDLPKGHKVVGRSSSSGTTGKPSHVLVTQWHRLSFSLLKQREYRWFGMDPHATLGVIRLPSWFPKIKGEALALGQTIRSSWPNVGHLFNTGLFFGFSVFNSIENQKKWLDKVDPDYLLAYAESLEHLAFQYGKASHHGKLKGLQSISETLTSDMGDRISETFPVPIHQNYGLNELGLVATKCPEGGRYHVHDEFFYVEIINENGEWCKPGERGKIIVTGTVNLAMPLLRYDTDDLALATDQDCPCGRTSPCFGEVLGRYSRIAYLPDGTLGNVGILRDALSDCPDDIGNDILKFQIHQESEHEFHLRLKLREGRLEDLIHYFKGAWNHSINSEDMILVITRVDDLKSGPNGKFHDFTSVFQP